MKVGRVEGLEVDKGIAVARIMGPQAKKKKASTTTTGNSAGRRTDGRTNLKTSEKGTTPACAVAAGRSPCGRGLEQGGRIKFSTGRGRWEVFDMHHQVGKKVGVGGTVGGRGQGQRRKREEPSVKTGLTDGIERDDGRIGRGEREVVGSGNREVVEVVVLLFGFG
jgi:hypothetical protein